jgi:GNAT superfamily N-acetyltransferase
MLIYRDALVADSHVVTRHRFEGSVGHDAERQAYQAWVSERIARGLYIGRLASDGGHVVSGAGIVLLDWGPTRGNVGGICARVVAVFTEPGFRRRGVASELVRQVMELATALGVRDFRLAASADGASIYRALGFRAYGAEMTFKR